MIAPRIEKLAPSGIREFFDLVLGMPEVISLGVGEPDFVTPWRIREKAITALEEGLTSYTSNKGLMILRKGISSRLKHKYGLNYDPEQQILVTVGISEGLDLALRAILSPNDKVIVPVPYYVAYPALVEVSCARPILLNTQAKDGFKIDLGLLKQALKQKPKAIILNYPSNPSGATYTEKELAALWRVIKPTDTLVITDEAYEELTYEGKHFSFAALDGKAKERTIVLQGFSKGHAMTGFRLGYACANKTITEAMTKIHSFSMLCTSIIAQVAGVEALRAENEVISMRQEYRRRRDFIVKELNRIGLPTQKPTGAFYCFPEIKSTGLKAMDFAKQLLFKEKVAAVPGTAFGLEGYLRMSYANSMDNLKEAIVRIERFVASL